MLTTKHQVPSAEAAEPDPAGLPGSPGVSPLQMVLNHSIAASTERRQVRLNDVARRQQRTTPAAGPARELRTEQRQLSREHLANAVRTQHRSQYAMARRTFDRLEQEILRDGRYLGNSTFMAEYS